MPYLRSKKTCIFNTISCRVCSYISFTTKGVWSIFLLKDLIHKNWIEIPLSIKNFSSKQL